MQDLDAVQIPWSLVGLLLLNFVEALAVGAAFHPSLQPIQRLENALTAYALLDLGRMLASETAAQEGCSVSSRWLSPQTNQHLQELCGLVAIAVMGLPGDAEFLPHRSSELPLEAFFGSLRAQFNSSQMSARDYCCASPKAMFQTMKRITSDHGCTFHTDQILDDAYLKPVSDAEFEACAACSLGAAVKLMACCSQSLGILLILFFLRTFKDDWLPCVSTSSFLQ